MRSVLLWAFALTSLALMAARARADKLILIPTADLGGYSAEYLQRTRGADEGIATVTFPTGPLVEALIRYNRNLDRSHNVEAGGTFQLLPQGYGTPSLAVGIWDITNDGPPGRRAFLVITKNFTRDDFVPAPLREIQTTLGIGTGRLGGPFLGVRASLPARLSLIGEWDSQRFNAGLWWTPIRGLTLKGELHNGNPFLGGRIQVGM
ncbi:MAG: hypothetical protein HY320_04045 [Armatimonadetes bacterium]|nr:hypothetical protein [Armatimonadota bacterium]